MVRSEKIYYQKKMSAAPSDPSPSASKEILYLPNIVKYKTIYVSLDQKIGVDVERMIEKFRTAIKEGWVFGTTMGRPVMIIIFFADRDDKTLEQRRREEVIAHLTKD